MHAVLGAEPRRDLLEQSDQLDGLHAIHLGMKILLHLAEHLQVRGKPLDVRLAFGAVAAEQRDEAEHDLHVVADPVLHLAQQHFALRHGLLELLLRELLVGDVDSRAEIAEELAGGGEIRPPGVEDPAVDPVMAAQPVGGAEFPAVPERLLVDRETLLAVVGMHALRPSLALRLLHGAAGEAQPRPVEPVAELVRAGAPDHHRRIVGQQQEILLGVTGLGKPGLGHQAAWYADLCPTGLV